jgi:hypothetical protein
MRETLSEQRAVRQDRPRRRPGGRSGGNGRIVEGEEAEKPNPVRGRQKVVLRGRREAHGGGKRRKGKAKC